MANRQTTCADDGTRIEQDRAQGDESQSEELLQVGQGMRRLTSEIASCRDVAAPSQSFIYKTPQRKLNNKSFPATPGRHAVPHVRPKKVRQRFMPR